MKKLKFAIYNYNFLRIIEPNKQLQLEFPEWQKVDVEESFENRQQMFDEDVWRHIATRLSHAISV